MDDVLIEKGPGCGQCTRSSSWCTDWQVKHRALWWGVRGWECARRRTPRASRSVILHPSGGSVEFCGENHVLEKVMTSWRVLQGHWSRYCDVQVKKPPSSPGLPLILIIFPIWNVCTAEQLVLITIPILSRSCYHRGSVGARLRRYNLEKSNKHYTHSNGRYGIIGWVEGDNGNCVCKLGRFLRGKNWFRECFGVSFWVIGVPLENWARSFPSNASGTCTTAGTIGVIHCEVGELERDMKRYTVWNYVYKRGIATSERIAIGKEAGRSF